MLPAVTGSSWLFLLSRTPSCVSLLIKSSNLVPFFLTNNFSFDF